MKIIMPTNWDDGLISGFKSLGIAECYGKLAVDAVGGGRSAFILPNVGRKRAAEHIRRLREAGICFNYLLNASCGSFREFTRSGDRNIQALLQWLTDIGVDSVTVASPYLMHMIKRKYPGMKVGVSTNAEVDSVQKALFWERLGADHITLSHFSVNRDFPLVRLIRKNVGCELRLIANTSCLFHCPLARYHSAFDAHGSQPGFLFRGGFSVDYCNLFCKLIRLSDPVQFIISQWIRPEDTGVYEAAGIDGFKLIDRRCSTAKLLQIATSYAGRNHGGNLIDLLPIFHGKTQGSLTSLFLKFRIFFQPLEFNMLRLFELDRLIRDFQIRIDNAGLSRFIEAFTDESCTMKDCSSCGHCARTAEKVLSYDRKYLEEIKERHKEFLEAFVRGEMFHY